MLDKDRVIEFLKTARNDSEQFRNSLQQLQCETSNSGWSPDCCDKIIKLENELLDIRNLLGDLIIQVAKEK